MNDERNDYGFPIVQRSPVVQRSLADAKAYAAEARERNTPPCKCKGCIEKELEPAVMNITKNWKQQS